MDDTNNMRYGKLFFVANILLVIFVVIFAFVLYRLQQTTFSGKEGELLVQEIYRKADLVIDTTKIIGNVRPFWTAFSQGGEEQSNMLAGTEARMRQLGVRYVRLDHIFDDDYYGVVKGNGNQLSLDWTKLDATVNSILAMGAKPFFSLGYMPSALAPSKIDKPYDWKKWQWLVEECIKHYSGSEGQAITDIYYEVWNEPDLESFGKWHYSGSKNYLTLYEYAARGAQKVRGLPNTQPFYIGGPGITAAYSNWITALVNFSQKAKLPLDFVSWHRYSYDEAKTLEDVLNARRWLAGKGNIQLVISEFGPDSEKTDIYSAPVAGAHAVASVRNLLASGLSWLFTFEVKDGPVQGNLGWGVLTHQDMSLLPKPRYKAYNLMRTMSGDRILVQGEGSTVQSWAVKTQDTISLIASNYSKVRSQTEVVPMTFKNLNPGTYLVFWEYLQGSGGEERVIVDQSGEYLKTLNLSSGNVVKLKMQKISYQ